MTDKKDIFLLERTKDSVSNIIGFYSTEEAAIAAVKRHIEATIDKAINVSHAETGQHTGIYIQEGFMISRNEVEIDEDAKFSKIEDEQEFPDADPDPEAGLSEERVEGRGYRDGTT